MTQEQKDLFIKAAQMGIACGLEHPYEWFVNYSRGIGVPYSAIEARGRLALSAFAQFFRECDSHPDDPRRTMTDDEFIDHVNQWYNRPK